ncbi:MAG: hypothetical protein MUF87_20555 [Anaerolineae bacterium]|nr:hypothetical protein [Anaerolineae bacterium]
MQPTGIIVSCDQGLWQAALDYSDASPTYLALLDHSGIHLAFTDKSQTYRVEGDNVEYAIICDILRAAHFVSLGA